MKIKIIRNKPKRLVFPALDLFELIREHPQGSMSDKKRNLSHGGGELRLYNNFIN